MTDEQIIKALECCSTPHTEVKCYCCKSTNGDICSKLNPTIILDLIRRQQAEINHFAEVNKMVVDLKTVKNDDEEILRLLVNQSVKFIPKNDDIKAIQRDAVINFAERLKEQAFECDISFGLGSQRIREAVAVDDIDNLVAEMFGNPEQVKGEENG